MKRVLPRINSSMEPDMIEISLQSADQISKLTSTSIAKGKNEVRIQLGEGSATVVTKTMYHKEEIGAFYKFTTLDMIKSFRLCLVCRKKETKDPTYAKILNSTLTSILGWAEKRLLAYHDTFDNENISSMQSIVSLGVSSAKILVEDISNEYRRRRKNEVDVARSRTDTYIRSRTAFAQIMEKADSSRRASRNKPNPLPMLAILAKDVGELATKEKRMFSPVFKRWHPLAAGVAVATLHVCFGNELKQFISGITDLIPDAVQVLRAADKLEQDLVQIAVEDSVDSDDGGKGIIREMPPFEAEATIANLVKGWTKLRLDRLKEWVDRNLQQELPTPMQTFTNDLMV